MSLSSCPKCWDVLCCCGWQYRQWKKEDRLYLAASALGVHIDNLRAAIDVPEKHPLLETPKWDNTCDKD